jgi:hypothetical protein
MDLGEPIEVVEVDLNPADTPAPYEGEPDAAPAEVREDELVPAGRAA